MITFRTFSSAEAGTQLTWTAMIRYESLPLETKDGRSIAVEFVSNVYGLNGGTRVIQCNIRDITKRKQAEDVRHRSDEETRRFFEANPAGSYVASPDGRLITCNSAFARMLGFASVEEAMKVDLVSLYSDRASRDVFLGRLKEKGRLEHNEAELRRKDGSLVHAVENAAGTFDERGELAEIHGCLMDASERQTEQQLRQAHKQQRFHIKAFLSKAGAGRTIVHVPGKQVLFEQGKLGNAVFYILTGMVKLTVVSQGKEVTIGLLGPGDFAGKDCIATVQSRRTASARALTNCTILRIERKEMLRVIQHEKTFAAFFLDYLLARVSRYQEVIMDQLLNSSEKRLARILLLLAHFGNEGTPETVVPKISQEDPSRDGWYHSLASQLFHEPLPKTGLRCLQGAKLYRHPYRQVVEVRNGLLTREEGRTWCLIVFDGSVALSPLSGPRIEREPRDCPFSIEPGPTRPRSIYWICRLPFLQQFYEQLIKG